MLSYNFNESIFKGYDIRGKVGGQEISQETAFFIGLCFGSMLKQGIVCIGRDVRSHSEELAEYVIKGLIETGIDVIDIGIVPTPVCYFGVPFLKADGCIMVTASHNPPEYNGFKLSLKDESLSGVNLKKFIEIAKQGIAGSDKKGVIKNLDIQNNYIDFVLKNLHFGSRKFKIGIDAMNGSSGELLQKICRLLHFDFEFINCNNSGDFILFMPEPSKSSNIINFQKIIAEKNLDLLFAFDGDGDRVLLITPQKVWYGDDILLLLAFSILPHNRGRDVIFDVKSSIVLEEEIPNLGGRAVIYKTGHSLIKQKMKEINAILAGEMSGHIYINDGKFYPFDDGVYAFLRVLEYISNFAIPHFLNTFKTPEIKLKFKDKLFFMEECEKFISTLNPIKILKIDGIKAYFENKSAILFRLSNTEDVIIMRVEAYHEKDFLALEEKINIFLDKLNLHA